MISINEVIETNAMISRDESGMSVRSYNGITAWTSAWAVHSRKPDNIYTRSTNEGKGSGLYRRGNLWMKYGIPIVNVVYLLG